MFGRRSFLYNNPTRRPPAVINAVDRMRVINVSGRRQGHLRTKGLHPGIPLPIPTFGQQNLVPMHALWPKGVCQKHRKQ